MHVVEQVTVKRPVAGLVGSEVELDALARLDRDRVLEWLMPVGRTYFIQPCPSE